MESTILGVTSSHLFQRSSRVVGAVCFMLFFLSSSNIATAQMRKSSGLNLSLQGGLDLPLADSSLVHSGAYDFSLTALLPASAFIDIVAGIGYQKFGQTDAKVDSGRGITNIPIFAGLRLIFDGPAILPYAGAEFSLNDLVYHATTGVASIPDITRIKFGYAIVAGTQIPFTHSVGADLTLKYHDIPSGNGDPDTKFISIEAGIIAHLDF